MRRTVLILAALLAAAPAAATQAPRGVDDPRAFVAETYAAYARANDAPIPEPAHAYSARLAALFEAYEAWARSHDDLVGPLDFDWWVNAQDWQISDVRVTEIDAGPSDRIVLAHFTNYDRIQANRFLFVRERGRWFLDDAMNVSGDDIWLLSALLRARPE